MSINLTNNQPKKKILIANNSQLMVQYTGGYPKQLNYLIKMFTELNFEIFYLMTLHKLPNTNHFTQSYTYDELKTIYIKYNYKDALESTILFNPLLREVKYLSMQKEIREVYVDDINMIIDKHNIDYFFFIGDIFTFRLNEGKQIKVPNYYWFPCHYYPFSKFDVNGLNCFSNIICLSPSIKLILEKDLPTKQIHFLPHVTEKTTVTAGKNELRRKWNIPTDKMIILMVATLFDEGNRKASDAQLIGFKKFNAKYPNSLLFVQCTVSSHETARYNNTTTLLSKYNFTNDNFFIHYEPVSEEHLAEFYTLSDVLLSCSKAEGFGVPILEAQLYGLSVITSNFLAMAEYNFQNNVTEISTITRNYSIEGTWTFPSSANITNKLEELYLQKYNPVSKPESIDELEWEVDASRSSTTKLCSSRRESNEFDKIIDSKLKQSTWITTKLTSYNNIKTNLYKIMKLL